MEKTIQIAVAEKIAESGEYVATVVIAKLAQVEIDNRVAAIIKAIQKQEQLEKELKKINKNDIVQYVGVGTATTATPTEMMSKARFDEIKKLSEKIEKLKKATDFALTENTPDSYNKLNETLKKLDNVGGNQKEDTSDGE